MNYRIDFRYKNASFNNEFTEELTKVCDWLKEWKEKHDNLIICGGAGVGKTWTIFAFLNETTKNARFIEDKRGGFYYSSDFEDIEYVRSKDLFDLIKLKFSKDIGTRRDAENYIWTWQTCKLLIIDEFPGSYETESEKIELMDIMDTRWRKGLPTVFLTNLNMKGLRDYLQDSLRQRVFDGASYVEIDEKTQRNKPKRL